MPAAPLERALTCTVCGAPLTLRSELARTVACGSCGAQLDLDSPAYAAFAQLRRRPDDTPLRVGLSGKLDGFDYTVAGFLRWRDPDSPASHWDDWFLVSAGGRTGWLRWDRTAWRLCHVVRPEDAEPIHLQKLDPESQYVTLDGERHLVLDRSRAAVEYLEGELLWKATEGETVVRLRCDPDISVEVGPNRVRYFRWSPVPWQNVAESFGVPDDAVEPEEPEPPPKPKKPVEIAPEASYEVPGFVPPEDDEPPPVWNRTLFRLVTGILLAVALATTQRWLPWLLRLHDSLVPEQNAPAARPWGGP